MDLKVFFFDLFFTLITPTYNEKLNENDVLNISIEELESVAEDNELYLKRATGKVKDATKIIDEIILKGNFNASEEAKKAILKLRTNRMRAALTNVDSVILNTLSYLKQKSIALCVISNADIIDTMFWKDSPLYPLFDSAIFSHDIGSVKPQSDIYQAAMDRMKVSPKNAYFIGDGGSDELLGAKQCGITTILTEYLLKRDTQRISELLPYADYHIKDFSELLQLPIYK